MSECTVREALDPIQEKERGKERGPSPKENGIAGVREGEEGEGGRPRLPPEHLPQEMVVVRGQEGMYSLALCFTSSERPCRDITPGHCVMWLEK